jgi:hypothetical protein
MTTSPLPDVLDFLFAPQRGKRVKLASQVSRRTREREVTAYQRAFPRVSRRQAQRRTAAMRRRGQVPRGVEVGQATPEQVTRAAEYRERVARVERAIVTLPEEVQPSDSTILSAGPVDAKRDELLAKSHWLYEVLEAEGEGRQFRYRESAFREHVSRMREDQLDIWLIAVNEQDYSIIRDYYAWIAPEEGRDSAFHYH